MELVIEICSDDVKAAAYVGSSPISVSECEPTEKYLSLRPAPPNYPNPEPGVVARLVVGIGQRPADILLRWSDIRKDGGCAKCEGGAVGFGILWQMLQDYRSKSIPGGGRTNRRIFVIHSFPPADVRELSRIGIVPGHEAVRRGIVSPSELREVTEGPGVSDASATFVFDPNYLVDLAQHTLVWLTANKDIDSRLPQSARRALEDVLEAAASVVAMDWERFHGVAIGDQNLTWRWWRPG